MILCAFHRLRVRPSYLGEKERNTTERRMEIKKKEEKKKGEVYGERGVRTEGQKEKV